MYEFPPMLGPCEDVPEGTPEWVLRLGARLRYQLENIERNGANSVIVSVRKVMTAIPRPWAIWPEKPCRTVDGYFELTCGLSWVRLLALIGTYHQDHDLERLLQIAKAENDGGRVSQGTRTDLDEHPDNGRMLSDGGNAQATLLRRLSRSHPEVLAAYERGEFKSVRAAAISAGIVKHKSHLDKLLSEWHLASDNERWAFMAKLGLCHVPRDPGKVATLTHSQNTLNL